jgi:DNA-binding CsgD family transcriptional regulator
MANETLARLSQTPPDSVAENDYRSFCAALGASARGRAFLSEYARRNRHADTEVVLQALARLEKTARGGQGTAPEADRIRQDLRALLDTLRTARPQVDNTPGAIKAATLAALIDFVQARIEALVTPARAGLSQVPDLEQPELPIPQPSALTPAAIALLRPDADAQSLAAAAERHDKASPADIVSDVKFIDIALVKPQPLDLAAAAETPMAIDTSMPAPRPAAAEAAALNTTTVAIEAYELWLDQLKVMQGDIEVSVELQADVRIEAQTETREDVQIDGQAATQRQAAAQKDAQPKKPADLNADLTATANLLPPVVTPEIAEAPQASAPQVAAPAPAQSEVAFKWPTLPEPQAAAPADAQSKAAFKWPTPAAPLAAEPRAAAPAAPRALAPGDPGFKWPEPAKPSALSPRQAAIVALAAEAEAEAKAKGQAVGQAVIAALTAEAKAKARGQIVEQTETPIAAPAAAAIVASTPAQGLSPAPASEDAQPATLSPRQAAIAALAAQNKAQQPVASEAPVVTPTAAPVAEQPVAQSGPLSPRQAAIAALAAQNKAQQPAMSAPQQPAVNQAPVVTPAADEPAAMSDALSTRRDPLAALAAQVEAQQSVTSHIPESDLTPAPEATPAVEPAKLADKPTIKPDADALDAIMTLTDEERIALFT